ncbi:MAG: hypothetical protein HWE26_13025 [Alteromonadaceae bacterium]|nr:hypothetical protein [Alteromonadaceae bacterium]
MNTKYYVNHFDEIAAFSEEEQLSLLEQARICTFTELKLGANSALYLVLALLAGFLLPVTSMTLFGSSVLYNAVAVGLGTVVSLLLYKTLNATLIHRGLTRVLAQKGMH